MIYIFERKGRRKAQLVSEVTEGKTRRFDASQPLRGNIVLDCFRDGGRVVRPMHVRLSRVRVRPDDLLAEAGQRRFEIGHERRHWQRQAASAPRDALLDGRARVGT